jgi:hypothetical protein
MLPCITDISELRPPAAISNQPINSGSCRISATDRSMAGGSSGSGPVAFAKARPVKIRVTPTNAERQVNAASP